MYLETLGVEIKDVITTLTDTTYKKEIIIFLKNTVKEYNRINIEKLKELIENKEPLDDIRNLIGNVCIVLKYIDLGIPVKEWTKETIKLIIDAIEVQIELIKNFDKTVVADKRIIFEDMNTRIHSGNLESINCYNCIIEAIKEAREIK